MCYCLASFCSTFQNSHTLRMLSDIPPCPRSLPLIVCGCETHLSVAEFHPAFSQSAAYFLAPFLLVATSFSGSFISRAPPRRKTLVQAGHVSARIWVVPKSYQREGQPRKTENEFRLDRLTTENRTMSVNPRWLSSVYFIER